MNDPKTLEVEGPTVLGISTFRRSTILGVAPPDEYSPDKSGKIGGRYRYVRIETNNTSKSGVRICNEED